MCALGGGFSCKVRDTVYKISCKGVGVDGRECENINYEGETSRSIGERFGEHMYALLSNSDSIRRRSVFYEHVVEEHGNVNPEISLELIARCPGDATIRQAIEAVSIRDGKPVLNSKDEWTNQPRKRRDRNQQN